MLRRGPFGLRTLDRLRAYLSRSKREQAWERELGSELGFWEDYLDSGGLEWPDEYAERLDPSTPLREHLIADRLDALPSPLISILDVGAGPMTTLGKTHPGKTLAITAVDPLATEYDRLLEQAGLTPPVRTVTCRGEDLLERFLPESFDVAYARNSLDHGNDPLLIIRNMVQLVKPGGLVVLRHYRTEGETELYTGLHQWNFEVEGGDFLVWSPQRRHNLTRVLGRQVELECWYEGGSEHAEWAVCVMVKHDR
jgi:SAM-dependent methyltransferase